MCNYFIVFFEKYFKTWHPQAQHTFLKPVMQCIWASYSLTVDVVFLLEMMRHERK